MRFPSRTLSFLTAALALAACQPTPPAVDYASANVISISYEAYGMTPTLTPQAIDLAVEHCRKQGNLYANYRGVTVPNILTAVEVHTFVCEATKTDDNAVIAAQNSTYMAAQTAAMPSFTTCNSIGSQTNCTSY